MRQVSHDRIKHMAKSVTRLYDSFHPDHYDLYLDIDDHKLTFSGKVVITGQKVGRPSHRISLHQKDLTILNANITYVGKHGDKDLTVDRINRQKTADEVRIHTAEQLLPGVYTVSVEFSGKITDPMHGIYPSNFKHNGKDKHIISTQFESNHAREAFPCIDEPEAKAMFDLTLQTSADVAVVSNMPQKSQKPAAKKRAITAFKTTPKMSPYLLAFAFGEMHSYEATTKDGVVVRSWCSVAQPRELLHYSVREGVKILEFFTDYFDIPFPLSKCDQIALPDFDAGAMENWGMITYREATLLADPSNRSISNEQFITLVIAHEMSHQWFGNLVTMEWWDDLWLNESFAAIMEHLAPDHIHPDWHQWELYSSSDIITTTSRDIYKDIQPVCVEVTDPNLIETIFDPTIVYAKGARLIKMLREYIGDVAFSKGLTAYFTKHAYSNTQRADLWETLSKASGKDIDALMTPWLKQPGLPVLHIDQNKQELTIKQERFMLDDSGSHQLWPVPLLAKQPLSQDVITKSETKLTTSSKDFVVLNQYGSGHFITHYKDADHRAAIVAAVQSRSLPTEARINILNDSLLLARHGDDSLTSTLDIIVDCATEPRDSVWGLIGQTIGYARVLTDGDDEAETMLKALRKKLAHKQYATLGWEDSPKDDPNTKQLRHTMIALMVASEDENAVQAALAHYSKAKSLEKLPAELRNTILAAAVKYGEATVVDELIQAYQDASAELQQDITSGLSATKDPAVAKKVLRQALGKDGFVRPQDVMRWFVLFLRNPYSRAVAWQFLVDEWSWFQDTLGQSKSFDFLPTYCASAITTKAWADKYKQFFEPKRKLKTLEHNIILGYADIDARVAWRTRDEAAIKRWLQTNTA